MAWTTPKEDWGATDAVPHTELNKVGANAAYLYDRIVMSGNPYLSTGVGSTTPAQIQKICVTVPDGYKLTLERWRFYLSHANGRLYTRADIIGGAMQHDETSTVNYEDAVQDIDFYTNSSGSDVDLVVIVGQVSTSGTIVNTGGWSVNWIVQAA